MSNPSEPTGSFTNVPESQSQPAEPATMPPAVPAEGETLPAAAPIPVEEVDSLAFLLLCEKNPLPSPPAAIEGETLPPADPNATVAPAATPTGVADEGDENTTTQSDAGERFSLPGYQILGKLGQGGMGVVYRAKHLKLGRVVALKMVLHAEHAQEGELVRFLGEAEAVAQLQHPNVVQLFESGQHNGLPYFTLELVEGGTLADKLRQNPLTPRDAARMIEQVALGVQHAHEKGIIHRDLKPGNVLLASGGREPPEGYDASGGSRPPLADVPKVADFGLAKRVDVGTALTATGNVLGTPSYMAPEQAGGSKQVGPAADIYSLGALLYECVSGRPPFRAATAMDTLLQVLKDEPLPLRALVPNCPRDLETVFSGIFGDGEPLQAA